LRERVLLKGEKISSGIGVGRLFFIDRKFVSIPHISLTGGKEAVLNEIERFKKAVSDSEQELVRIISDKKTPDQTRSILEVHRMMLTDPTVSELVLKTVTEKKINAEWAVLDVFDELTRMLEGNNSGYYIKAKIVDMEVVRDKLISKLAGGVSSTLLEIPEEDLVICSHSLTVSELNYFSQFPNVKGIVLESPGGVSHLTVVLRALEIPAVMGVPSLISNIDYGDIVIVDGVNGEVVLRPDRSEIKDAIRKNKRFEKYFARFLENVETPSVSRDGHVLKVGGNIDQPGEVPFVKKYGGEFIGLFRTELMFPEKQVVPSEDRHYEIYSQVLHFANPLRATIRIFDFGEDKEGAIVHKGFMGMRGIRLCKRRPDVFIPQIRGLIRAAEQGNLNILLPFVSNVHEVDDFKELLFKEAAKMGLSRNLDNVELGAMIEVPSAIFIAEQIAKEVSFFSVGTNDLIQYLMAVERKDQYSSNYFSHFHPSVIRVLFNLAHIAKEQGKEISICGEMAADRYFPLVFLAMGISSLSMSPISIPIIKKIIKCGYIKEGDVMLKKMLVAKKNSQVIKILRDFMVDRYPNIFTETWNNN
jgi:phosphoenolpyruvate-protein phosphotransferase (PTS system enzyme I)